MLDLLGLATSETSDTVTPAPTSNETPINDDPQTVVTKTGQTSLHHDPIAVQNYQQEIASLKAQIASLEAENARLQAYPTRTLPAKIPLRSKRKFQPTLTPTTKTSETSNKITPIIQTLFTN